jgi:hypothetical protein
MSSRRKRVNSLASGSNEDCRDLLPVADRMTPSAENYQTPLAQPQHSSAFPSFSNRISDTLVFPLGQPGVQMCRNRLHIEIQTMASIFILQTVTLKFGD